MKHDDRIMFEVEVGPWGQHSYPVAVENFDYESLDSPEDAARELLNAGKPIQPLIDRLARRLAEDRVWEAINQVIAMVVDAPRPRLAADQISWVSGMRIRQGQTGADLARKYRISKQAFNQGAMKLASQLQLRPARYMRDEIAREKMSRRNYRHHVIKVDPA